MKGTSTKTPERVATALKMRADGYRLRDIAAELGIALSTADAWINDTDGSRCKARKESYSGACADCGARTDGSAGPGQASKRCVPCFIQWQHDHRKWTPETVVVAVREWVGRHGRPPTATDWRRAGETWPASSTVQGVHGSWNAAITAAGFTPLEVGHYGRPGEDPETKAKAAELYASGLSSAKVAAILGVAPETVRTEARARGIAIREPSEWGGLPTETRERIVPLYCEGRTMQEVADELGCSHFTVWRYINKAGAARSSWATRRILASRKVAA